MQEKEVMEAAVRAFEDWEFRVLEQESGIEEEDHSVSDKESGGETEKEAEREISRQQHVVNTAQVNVGTLQRLSQLLCDALHRFAAFSDLRVSASMWD